MRFRARNLLFQPKDAYFGQGSLENLHVFEVKGGLFTLPTKIVFKTVFEVHLIYIYRNQEFFAESELDSAQKTLFLPKIRH
jgi:hypothetical protein